MTPKDLECATCKARSARACRTPVEHVAALYGGKDNAAGVRMALDRLESGEWDLDYYHAARVDAWVRHSAADQELLFGQLAELREELRKMMVR